MNPFEEQNNTGYDFLKATVRIGSCKGPISYGSSQTVFHHDDIPKKNRARKQDVLEWKKSRILSVERGNWNKSTDPNMPVCERRTMENFVHDRSGKYTYNFRAESVDPLRNLEPIDKASKFHVSGQLESTAKEIDDLRRSNLLQSGYHRRTQEIPSNVALESMPSWNNSTYITPKDMEVNLNNKTRHAREKTAKKNSFLGTTVEYSNPIRNSMKYQEKVRQQKRDGVFNANESLNRPHSHNDEKFPFRNREAVEKSKIYYSDEHSGAWQYNECEKRYMWSDTGSFQFESRGDVVHRHNPNAWNYASTSIPRPLTIGTAHGNANHLTGSSNLHKNGGGGNNDNNSTMQRSYSSN